MFKVTRETCKPPFLIKKNISIKYISFHTVYTADSSLLLQLSGKQSWT